MTTLYQRLLPHPHLAPWTDDYPDGLFSAHLDQAHYTDGRNISLNITFNLESPTLEDLVQAGMAAYAALVDCPSTFTRRLDTFNLPEGTILLPSSEFSADFTATPHVVAITDLTLPSGPEIAEEYRSLRPAGIDLSAGAILATGGSLAISPQEVAVHSVIDLVTDSSIRRGAFTVTLDDNRIKIKVDRDTKSGIDALRRRGGASTEMAVLFATLYQSAITEALRDLDDHEGTQWHDTLRKALEQIDASISIDDLKHNASHYAQLLMQHPLDNLITAFTHDDV